MILITEDASTLAWRQGTLSLGRERNFLMGTGQNKWATSREKPGLKLGMMELWQAQHMVIMGLFSESYISMTKSLKGGVIL